MDLERLLESEQVERNRRSRGQWDRYAAHRQKVTELLLASGAPGASLCVLGAGNCNDLDLSRLLNQYASIDLIDIDTAALRSGLEQQGLSTHPGVRVHGDFDATGTLPLLSRWSQSACPDEHDTKEIARSAREADVTLPGGPFDVVASVGLLTQLIECAASALGDHHPLAAELFAAVRERHLRLLLDHVAPAGTAVLVTEVVSSDSAPSLADCELYQLPMLLGWLFTDRNFFSGVHPGVLQRTFLKNSLVRKSDESVRVSEPWLWHFFERVYACVAVTATRTADRSSG